MKTVLQVGGPVDLEKDAVGPARQLRVDESNWDLRLHDGTTPGGRVIQNRDNADERYQAKSIELGGIGPYTAEQRGFLSRRGAGEYRLRKLTVSTSLTVVNPDGYAGDPLLDISDVISGEKRFEDEITFDSTIQANGGVMGNTSGIHYGESVGNHTGNVIGNLTGNSVGNHAGPTNGMHTGGIDTRGSSVLFNTGQIPINAINGILDYVRTNGVPIGTILMWSGTIASIPSGWSLCNGANGTPDLRGRFIQGASEIIDPGTTGGATTHTHNATIASSGGHNHALAVAYHELTIAEMPAHTHKAAGSRYGDNHAPGVDPILYSSSGDSTFPAVTSGPESTVTGAGNGHGHDMVVGSDGPHTHPIVVPTVDSRPLFYSLCYIMHTG